MRVDMTFPRWEALKAAELKISRILVIGVVCLAGLLILRRVIWINQDQAFDRDDWKEADVDSIYNPRYKMWKGGQDKVLASAKTRDKALRNLGPPDFTKDGDDLTYKLGAPDELLPWGVDRFQLTIRYDKGGKYLFHAVTD